MARPTSVDADELPSIDPRVEATREAAISAARELLVQEGWDAVTHLRVSERSGLGRATMYRHWPDSSALLRDTLATEALAVQVPLTGVLRRDLINQLRSLRDWLFHHDGARILAALVDRAQWEPHIAEVMATLVREGVMRLGLALTDAYEDGALRPGLTPELGVAQLFGPVVYQCLIAGEEVPDEYVEALVADFLDRSGSVGS